MEQSEEGEITALKRQTMKRLRLYTGVITLLLSIAFISKNLLWIVRGLLSPEVSSLNLFQIVAVSCVFMVSGVVFIIYNDTTTLAIRLIQFILSFAGTAFTLIAVNAEDMFCNAIKIWLCIATVIMLFVLLFDRTEKETGSEHLNRKETAVYRNVFSSTWGNDAPKDVHAEYCPFCGKKTVSGDRNKPADYYICRFCNARYRVTKI